MPLCSQLESPVALDTTVINSPEDIVTVAAKSRLLMSSYIELRRVSCEFRNGVLTLRGCVPRYYLKQIAQTILAGLSGVADIDNQLQVTPLSGENELEVSDRGIP